MEYGIDIAQTKALKNATPKTCRGGARLVGYSGDVERLNCRLESTCSFLDLRASFSGVYVSSTKKINKSF
jgi:hypothetical protein